MKYSIYLLNREYQRIEDVRLLLIDPDYARVKNKWATPEFDFAFYLKQNDPKPPSWVGQFEDFVELPIDEMATPYSSAVILVRKKFPKESRVFAIAFGGGWHVIKDEMKEMGFGLRIVLNVLVREGIKGGQARKLAGDTKSKNISLGNPSRFYDLEFNDEMELVKSLRGRSQDIDFASNVSGADSLVISTKVDFSELEKVLDKAYGYFNSKDYREDYGFIDKFRPLGKGHKALIENLNLELVKLLENPDRTKISMIAPQSLINKGIEEWSIRVTASEVSEIEDLSLFEVLELINHIDPGFKYDLNSITNPGVIGIIPYEDGRLATEQTKPILDFLSAEISFKKENYILLDGNWYYVDSEYLNELHRTLSRAEVVTKVTGHRFPTWGKSGKFYLNEAIYNKQVVRARRNNLILMDKELFGVPDANQYSKIEICDILSDNLEFIHVKKCLRSQDYAYLFDQGMVAMETLFRFHQEETMEFISRQISKNPRSYIKYEKLKDNLHGIQLVYAIATKKKPDNFVKNLPFFSKIVLFRTIKAVGALLTKPIKIILIPFED